MSRRTLDVVGFLVAVAVLALTLGGITGQVVAHHETQEVVVGHLVATPEGEPVARWYLEVERTDGARRLVEVGPALAALNCFPVGDAYEERSVGRCENVVWP